ncbi:TRAP dicarboxylate transporter subunit DctP [Bacillus freudenreichii]|nr:TRAP dicarboxylate transporter subunit DctP [Bacillus freudenreichii]
MRKLLVGLLLLCVVFVSACAQKTVTRASDEHSQEPVTFTAVSFLPKNDPLTITLNEWIEEVEKVTEGRVKIDWKGGANIIPVNLQFEALRSEIVDVLFTYTGQYHSQAPAVSALPLSQLSPWEERENGLYEEMVKEHKSLGVHYIGRWLSGSPRIWLNDPIEELAELDGMQIRSAPNYRRFFNDIGITSVMVAPTEVYTSLQTGVVNGFVYGGLVGPRRNGWTDASKYVLDHPFWNQNCTILMNDDKWNEISPEDQESIIEATAAYEKNMVKHYLEEDEAEKEELTEAGVEFIQLSPQEAETFIDRAYEVEWGYLEDQVPDKVERLRELTAKNKN